MKERDTNNLSFPQLAQIISRNTAEAFLENLEECLNLLESQGRAKKMYVKKFVLMIGSYAFVTKLKPVFQQMA